MSNLTRLFERRTTRGTTRGADAVWAAANSTGTSPAPTTRQRPWLVFAGAFAVVLAVGVTMNLLTRQDGQSPVYTTPSGVECQNPDILDEEFLAQRNPEWLEMSATPEQVRPGQTTVLTIKPGGQLDPSTTVGLASTWRCWNGSEWEPLFLLLKGYGEWAPQVAPLDTPYEDFGLAIPAEVEILIPNVPPGIYMIHESDIVPGGVIVEVIEEGTPPTPETPTNTFPPATTPSGAECHTPPASALAPSEGWFQLEVTPGPVRPGSIATLSIKPHALNSPRDHTGLASWWECWNGSEWEPMYLLHKGLEGWEARVLPLDSFIELPGLGLPLDAKILIPAVPPGIYRLVEDMDWSWSYTFVEVVDDDSTGD